MTAGKHVDQIKHVEKALESIKARLKVLQELLPKAPETKPTVEGDAKGKGKATTVQENPLGWTPKIEVLEDMTKPEIEAEIKDVQSLAQELEEKVSSTVASTNLHLIHLDLAGGHPRNSRRWRCRHNNGSC